MQIKNVSLTARLIITASLVSFVALFAVGIVLSAIFHSTLEKSFDLGLKVNLDALAASSEVKNDIIDVPRSPTDPRFTRPLSGYYWQVSFIDNQGQISNIIRSRSLFDEQLNAPNQLLLDAKNLKGETAFINIKRADENLRLAARIIQLPNVQTPILLLVTGDVNEINNSINYFNQILIISLVTLAIGFIAANFLQVKVGLFPLRKMGRELALMRDGSENSLDENIAPELAPIAKELNALLLHNREVVDRARTHVGNLAHALKTPISVMLNEAKTDKSQLGELVENQAQNMTRQVEHYLKRARAAARAEISRERIIIQNGVDDLVRTLSRLCARDGVQIEIIGKTDAFFRGDREDLEDLIGNLCENACKYGGGLVEISFKESADEINIIIEDDGEGLNPSQIKDALRRGVRLDETSHGSGLGLNIADETARAYGGYLHLEDSELGGLKVNLHLPVTNT